MVWEKHGLIFNTKCAEPWSLSHAQVPLAEKVSDEVIRIYYGTRDLENRTRTSYIEVEARNPENVLYVHPKPILSLGDTGFFDDSGVMPSEIIEHCGVKYFYYVGWNTGTTARYRTALGLAISEDGGRTFHKISRGPIMDRNITDPVSISCQSILIENEKWKTWYMSYLKWKKLNNKLEPFYQIKYAESNDGIVWDRKNIICIPLKGNEGGIACPTVIKDKGMYKMWYSVRGREGYRRSKKQSYRIGYAESENGIQWNRRDDLAGIDVSEEGWDSEMIAYPYVYKNNGKLIMLYNGNGFGKTGFGYAVLKD